MDTAWDAPAVPAKSVADRLAELQKAAEGGLNLDALTNSECGNVWAAIHFAPVRAARLLFPEQPYGYVRATRDLGHYAINRAAAHGCRIDGRISTAQMYDRICQGIYDKLPAFARW